MTPLLRNFGLNPFGHFLTTTGWGECANCGRAVEAELSLPRYCALCRPYFDREEEDADVGTVEMAGECHCHRCQLERLRGSSGEVTQLTMPSCSCGNKRCPKATDHRFECTGSNEPGQPGSIYGVAS